MNDRRILISYDGSESADAAIAVAARLVGRSHANAVVLSVWEPLAVDVLHAPPMPVEVQAQRLAEQGARLAGEAGFDARARWVADERRIAATIVEGACELDTDLIVIGARGLTGIAALFGSVANHVVQRASRPVLVVPCD
jgi:nucleotide-binding universal stress UspA family protein